MTKNPKHPDGQQPSQGAGGDGAARRIKGTVEVEARLPRELTEEYSGSSKETSGRENQRLLLEKITLVVLLCVALLNLFQARQSSRSASAAENAANIARDTLKVSQRPWVFMDVQANSDVNYTNEDGMYMNVVFNLRNLGPTPAVNARVDYAVVSEGVDEAIKKTCADAEVKPDHAKDAALREAYFAGMTTPKGFIVTFDPVKQGHSDQNNGTFEPILIGCAAYQSSFDPGTWHHTWKAVSLLKKDTRSPNGIYVMEVGKPVKKEDVVFGPWVHPEGED